MRWLGRQQIAPFYEHLFRGILMLFLLEMGMTAVRQLRDFAKVGGLMVGFALLAPVVFGVLGVALGAAIGLDRGSAFVLGAVCASASYIDAPAACRAALPTASPGIYLTASLADGVAGGDVPVRPAGWVPVVLAGCGVVGCVRGMA